MVNRAIKTADPAEARRQRERAAQKRQQQASQPPAVDWKERRARGEIPGLIRRAEDRQS